MIYLHFIEKLKAPLEGYTCYVRTVASDDGITYYDTGIYKYFKTEKRASEYIEALKEMLER